MNTNAITISSRLSLATAVLGVGIALSGCGRGGDASDDDLAAAEQASTSAESGGDVALISSYFTAAGATIAEVPVGEATGVVLADIAATIRADLADSDCVAIDTDDQTFVEVTFTGCTGAGGLVSLDGSVRGELSFEAAPCGPFDCPTATIVDVATSNLTVGQTSIAGAWQVRAPLADEAHTFSGAISVIGPNGRSIDAETAASFTVSDGCTTLSSTTTIDRAVGTATVTVSDVTRCAGSCAQSGQVAIQYAGASLSWVYNGDDTITVIGPRGNDIELSLLCAY